MQLRMSQMLKPIRIATETGFYRTVGNQDIFSISPAKSICARGYRYLLVPSNNIAIRDRDVFTIAHIKTIGIGDQHAVINVDIGLLSQKSRSAYYKTNIRITQFPFYNVLSLINV